jgi:hypothetical protein
MKKILLLLLLFSTPLHAEVYGPEPNWEYNNEEPIPVKEFESPTNNQLWAFWILNAIDVYATDRVMRKCPDCKEINPLLPKRPSLEELLLHKAIVGGIIHKYGSRTVVRNVNGLLSIGIVHNINISQ